MYELIQAGPNTYYMDCPSKVGFYKITESDVVLIDSGNDGDSAKKVKRLLEEKHWNLKTIYNTHSHADHIGGNQYLQKYSNCKIYAPAIESCFVEYPALESAFSYGGFPVEELHNKFLMAKASKVEVLTPECLPPGMEIINLPGHCMDMVGYSTDDGVSFIADSLSSEATLQKYQIGYIYDVKAYLETLEKLKTLSAKVFVPSHAEAQSDISKLADINIEKTKHIINQVKSLLKTPKTFENLLRDIFNAYNINLNCLQFVLIGGTLKSYLSYLNNLNEVEYYFEDNRMLWKCL